MVNTSAKTLVLTTFRTDNVQGEVGEGVAELLNEPVDIAEFQELEFVIHDEVELYWSGRELGTYDKIIMYGGASRLLRITHPLALVLKHRGINAFTSGAEAYLGYDKLAQNVFFSLYNIPIPKTYFAGPKILIQNAAEHVGFPMIIKDILASQGERNFLVSSQEELEEKLQDIETDRYIAQQYVENDGDLRVLVNERGNTFVFERKGVSGSHLNNTSAGGVAREVADPPEKLLEYCKAILKARDAPLLGIDVIPRHDGFYFLEANMQPMIFTGELTDQKKAFFRDTITN